MQSARIVWIGLLLAAGAHASASEFHFVIIGDRTGRAVPGVYEEVWREALQTHPDFVITVGDAIEGWNGAGAVAEWASVRKSWPTAIPVFHTPGNHDIWDNASEKLYRAETGRKPFYSFDFKDAHFVVLDNSRTDALPPEDMQFLRSDLSANGSKRPIFVFFHRPFWLLPLKLGVHDLELARLAEQYGICCVISGHGHQFEQVKNKGTLFLEVGSSGASLAGAGPAGIGYEDGWFYQYAFVTVKGLDVSFEIRELQPPFGKGRVITLHAGAVH